eukprot:scaffold170229_cov83-Attheya_sp.AAC.1
MTSHMIILCISILASLNGLNGILMLEYTKVGLKIARCLTKGREPLPICRDCFDSGMNLVFSEKATHFKTKGQEDELNKEKRRKKLEAAGKREC